MAPQLATVDVTLNAFYGAPMLSPTTRSLQNLTINLIIVCLSENYLDSTFSYDDSRLNLNGYILLRYPPPARHRHPTENDAIREQDEEDNNVDNNEYEVVNLSIGHSVDLVTPISPHSSIQSREIMAAISAFRAVMMQRVDGKKVS